MTRAYLVASDFDQTLSFNDSGIVLSDLLGIPGYREKAAGLSGLNLVQHPFPPTSASTQCWPKPGDYFGYFTDPNGYL